MPSNFITQPPALHFTPEDLEDAHAEWGANCGPAALAAAIGCTLDYVRPHLGDFATRGYMNPSMMKTAIRTLGFAVRYPETDNPFPMHGIVRVQWGGRWLDPGVPVGAAYVRTHWIATKRHQAEHWIYDVNAGWLPQYEWRRDIVPRLIAATRGADGSFTYIDRWEVRRARR